MRYQLYTCLSEIIYQCRIFNLTYAASVEEIQLCIVTSFSFVPIEYFPVFYIQGWYFPCLVKLPISLPEDQCLCRDSIFMYKWHIHFLSFYPLHLLLRCQQLNPGLVK